MPNYLLKILQNYFDEILVLEGNVSITESLLKAKANEIITENRRHKNIIDAITSYSNITSIKVPPNSGNPNFIYSITTDDLEERIVDIHSQQCCYTVSQAYEIFENFLIEIISEFLFHNQPFLKVLKVSEGIVLISKDTIKSLITNNKIKKSNNKGLLWMVRKISPDFKRNESHNLLNENISTWFDLFSMIRHTLVHNRQVISKGFLKYLKEHKADTLFDKHFKRKQIRKNICIFLDKSQVTEITHWLNSYAHLIFVCLSLTVNLSVQVPQYLPHSETLYR